MNIKDMAVLAAKAMDAKRGFDIVALKVDELTVITDYMVIGSGHNVNQVKALAENVEEELAKKEVFVKRKEGVNEGKWVVLDYGDLMVHIFLESDRAYYRLDHLWSNGNNQLEIDFDTEPSEEA